VERLAAALNKIVRSPAVQQKFLAVGTLPKPSTTAEFDAFLKAEYTRWGKAIAASGIKAD
jgi:tripartite-type tricarboxylate transporter receptor subunit TctC